MPNTSSRSELCARILAASRQLMISSRFTETCMQEGTPKQLELIARLFDDEIAQRQENKIARLVKRAGFPMIKSFEGYSADKAVFPEGLSFSDVRDASFVDAKENLVLYGPVGTGKTHMAVAAGLVACNRGLATKFYTVAALVRQLTAASAAGKMDKFLQDLRKLDLLILDEWGYVPIDREGAQLLFQVITDSYESKSLIITTNLEFSRWGTVLTDEQMAAAIIDRLVHHGHLILFDGQSYRMEHALMRAGTPQAAAG